MSELIECPVYLTESYKWPCTCGQHSRQNRRVRTRVIAERNGQYSTTEAIYSNGGVLSVSDLWFPTSNSPSFRIGIWVATGAVINEVVWSSNE